MHFSLGSLRRQQTFRLRYEKVGEISIDDLEGTGKRNIVGDVHRLWANFDCEQVAKKRMGPVPKEARTEDSHTKLRVVVSPSATAPDLEVSLTSVH